MKNRIVYVGKARKRYWRETFHAYLFLLPAFIILGAFVFWPIGYSLILSFFKWDFTNQRAPFFHGFTNYTQLFKLQMALPYSFWQACVYSAFYIVAAFLLARLVFLWTHYFKAFESHRLGRERLLKMTAIYAALTVLGLLFAHNGLIWPLFGTVVLMGSLYFFENRRPYAFKKPMGLWSLAVSVLLLYFVLKRISLVRYELFDFLLLTKESSVFVKSIFNTIYYVILTTPAEIVISLFIALLLNLPLKLKPFFRTAYFVPYVTSVVAISLVWRWIFNDEYGLFNYFLSLIDISKVKWLTQETWTIPTIAIVSIWKSVGYNAIIFLAGLQSIDKSYYEAAKVDGASNLQNFYHITWPLLSPTTFFILIVSVIGNFKVFTQVYVLYQALPGPYNNSGMTMVYYIFDRFYAHQQMGEASAAAYVLFMIILVLTFFQFRVGKQRVQYVG
ncbi:MAG: Lactose transport system permease protein LacF [Thermotogae bacterium ADurb.Bin062]|nr:MAG: Lactose transport system permease protein LacF [Thermotogota bacterium ADurb.Bin062]